MMNPISRRRVLQGFGTALALPLLDAMAPRTAYGQSARPAARAPKRLGWFYVPNGVHMQDWRPTQEGSDFQLPKTLEPLNPFKNDLLVLTGLTLDKARPHGDGGGDHARALAAFLTGSQPLKTHGADIRVGISVDQVAAQHIGHLTRFPSLELGIDRGQNAGNCDSGYSCAYSGNISWRTPNTPMSKEINPRLVFERLFTNGNDAEALASRSRREQYNASILDFVLEDARALQRQVGMTDQRKLEEYLSSVREVEQRIAMTARAARVDAPDYPRPEGIPREFQEHVRLMFDLLALAYQGDVTRVGTLMFANEGSNRNYQTIGVNDGHHDLSHHGGNRDKQTKIQKINEFHITQFAYFLDKLRSIREGDGTLLDNCMLVYGSGNSDGDRHNHDDLPILLAGHGGGTLQTGRHLRYANETPLMNLFLSMLERVDVHVERHGDSNGRLNNLS